MGSGKLAILWRLMRGRRLQYAGAIAALAVATLFSFLIPQVIRIAIDGVIGHNPAKTPGFAARWIEQTGVGQALAFAAACVVVLNVLSGYFTYLRGRWAAEAAEAIMRRVRDRLYDHLQRLPTAYLAKADTGDIVQRCTSDVETIRLFLASQIVEIGRGALMLAIVFPLMLRMDARMTWVSLAAVPVIIAFSAAFFLKIKAVFKEADEAEGELTTVLQENLTGIRVVRAFARQEFECQKFAVKNALFRDRVRRLIDLMAWFWPTSDFLCLLQGGAALIAGGYWVAKGQLTVGTLYAFTTYVFMLLWPVRQMGRILTDLGKTLVSLGRLREILDEPPEADPPAAAVLDPGGGLKGHIVVRQLSFSYDGQIPALQGVSFKVRPGQTLALLGPTGSGKSTLAHLLLRLHDYREGSISIDGHELGQLSRRFVRSHIGMVLQEPFLYSKTVGENIRLAGPDADEAAVVQAASVACVHDSILQFERGYDTLVGERGVMLSGGQRQRVALAQAVLRDPPILILDDALSAVDTRTESMILDALRSRHGRRATIVIAHRLSTLMQADWIIVLDRGRVVQAGTHESLSRKEGLYKRLWQIQGALQEDLARA